MSAAFDATAAGATMTGLFRFPMMKKRASCQKFKFGFGSAAMLTKFCGSASACVQQELIAHRLNYWSRMRSGQRITITMTSWPWLMAMPAMPAPISTRLRTRTVLTAIRKLKRDSLSLASPTCKNSARKFLRDESGHAFGDLGVVAVVLALLSCAYIALSSPNLPQIVESVTVGQVLAIAPDGYADGIALTEKPARVFLVGGQQ